MATRRQREAAAPPLQAANAGAYIYTIIIQSGWSDSDLRPGRIARGLFVSVFRAIFESVRCYGLIRVHLGSIIDFVNSHCMSASLPAVRNAKMRMPSMDQLLTQYLSWG